MTSILIALEETQPSSEAPGRSRALRPKHRRSKEEQAEDVSRRSGCPGLPDGRHTAAGSGVTAEALIDIIRRRSINHAPQQPDDRVAPLLSRPEIDMDQDPLTPLPPTIIAMTREARAAPGNALHKLLIAGQAWIDGCQAINAEMLAFWQSRLKAGLAVGGELLECTSVEDALEVQVDHAKAAMQAYLDQSGRIAGLLLQALDAGSLRDPVSTSPKGQARAMAA